MSKFNQGMQSTTQSKFRYNQTIRYLRDKLKATDKILDIGARNELTRLIENEFDVNVDNTRGDLDTHFTTTDRYYDVIICSHVLEHLFNPIGLLNTLDEISEADAVMFVMLPCRPKWLWTKQHYHEIDYYRLSALAENSGWQIIKREYFKAWRNPLSYFTGIRMFLRLFFEWNVHYILVKS